MKKAPAADLPMVNLHPGELFVAQEPTLITTILGSCVSVCLFCPKQKIGAMCHGVMLVYTARAIKGRRLTAYQGIRPDIELLGGTFLDQEVVVDGSLITSRGWPDLPGFMREFTKLLARKR